MIAGPDRCLRAGRSRTRSNNALQLLSVPLRVRAPVAEEGDASADLLLSTTRRPGTPRRPPPSRRLFPRVPEEVVIQRGGGGEVAEDRAPRSTTSASMRPTEAYYHGAPDGHPARRRARIERDHGLVRGPRIRASPAEVRQRLHGCRRDAPPRGINKPSACKKKRTKKELHARVREDPPAAECEKKQSRIPRPRFQRVQETAAAVTGTTRDPAPTVHDGWPQSRARATRAHDYLRLEQLKSQGEGGRGAARERAGADRADRRAHLGVESQLDPAQRRGVLTLEGQPSRTLS
jgi:hypothetical protein